MAETAIPQIQVVIPASVPMVALLGPNDEFLRIVEREFDAGVHVRGNQITLSGTGD